MQAPPTAVREAAGNNTGGTAPEDCPGTTEDTGTSVRFVSGTAEKDPGQQGPEDEPGAMPGRVHARLGLAPQVRTGPTSMCTNRDRP